MHLVRMNFSGVPPITEPVAFQFDERVNLFIGPNASGKSVLLRLLTDAVTGPKDNSQRLIPHGQNFLGLSLIVDEEFDDFLENPPLGDRPPHFMSVSDDWPLFGPEPGRDGPKPPAIYIGAVREGLPAISNQPNPDAFGATAAEVLSGPFSGSRTVAADRLLGNETTPDARMVLIDATELANTCSQRICAEVIRKSRPQNYIPGPDMRGYLLYAYPNLNRITILPSLGIDLTDDRKFDHLPGDEQPDYSAYPGGKDSAPIYLGHASSGTEGTLLWIRWLALKMVHHYGFIEDWAHQPAILLIDEIENHLHPTWQRRVIPALLEHFPKLQIFATTHSPFVVAGLKRGQIHRLYREGGVIKTDKLTDEEKEQLITGWTVEEILREFMDVDDPTDEATAEAAATLRWLRERYPSDGSAKDWVAERIAQLEGSQERTRDENVALSWLKSLRPSSLNAGAKEWRESAMEGLRAKVSLDLEAGGPFAAQRELFLEQLRELLADDEANSRDPDEEG